MTGIELMVVGIILFGSCGILLCILGIIVTIVTGDSPICPMMNIGTIAPTKLGNNDQLALNTKK